MASTKTIASFFVRDKAVEIPFVPPPTASENESHDSDSARSGSDNDERSEVNERLDEQEIADDDEAQLTQREPTRKRRSAPHFGHQPIIRKKTTRCGSILLTSVEETAVPIMSIRARDREPKRLQTNNAVIASCDTTTEIRLRIKDPENHGHLVTKSIDGKLALWCSICAKKVSSNKSNTKNHMQSYMHASNVVAKGSTATEDAILATGLRKWRLGNRDIEGRNVAENNDLLRLKFVKELMTAGIPIAKVC